jgi:2-C-methyl-D-erythritol 4-phosphate cytidylyltransferase
MQKEHQEMHNIKAVILASGAGARFNDFKPKQFVKLAGLPVLVHTLKVFQACPKIREVVVVTQEQYVEQVWGYVHHYGLSKAVRVVVGGATRQESSSIGLKCCGDDTDYVLIHDAVRPFLTQRILDDLVNAVIQHGAVDTVIPSADTIVEIDGEGFIKNIPDRSALRRGQTPQAFDYRLICEAHDRALRGGVENSTDDCALVLRMGKKAFVVHGDEQNIKITFPLDLHIADKLFQLKMHNVTGDDELNILRDRVFVIIGGTSGIGLKLVEQLRGYSSHVYSFSRSTNPSVDVADFPSIVRMVEYVLGSAERIDYLINCSGDLIRKNVEMMTLEEWHHIYETNITGNFALAKAVIPVFKQQKGGTIVFVGSSSYTRGREGYSAYSSSKAALVNFCQALAEELSPWNIKVNVASPGRVNTPLRFRNFGKEDPATLLDPDHVAREVIKSLMVDTTGSVFEIT